MKQIVFLFIFIISYVNADEDLVIEIADGQIRGARNQTDEGREFITFRGIPYAQPPCGEYRFMDPQPLQPWDGVLNASQYSPACFQYNAFTAQITGDEDCLYLNVFTVKPNKTALLPVIVFIHGGGFISGASFQYDPIKLMNFDVVVVTMNYRLGVLGFLSTGDSIVPGNAGLKDQAVALHWIKNNIENFGGDPNSITLTGQSAGAASVDYHFLSPWSNGTFHKGAAYSGTALAPWALDEKPVEKTQFVADAVGCSIENTIEMIECLKNASANALALAQLDMIGDPVRIFPVFGPVIEASDVENPFIAQHPYTIVQSGALQKLPLLTGVTLNEGLLPGAAYQSASNLLPEVEARWEELASAIFTYNDTLPISYRQLTAQKIKEYYFGNNSVSQDTFSQFVQALGDRQFKSVVGLRAQLHALYAEQSTYYHVYSYSGSRSFSNILANNAVSYGVCHLDDVLHIFKAFDLDSDSAGDVAMSAALLQILYSYALTGVPIVPDGQVWPTVVPGSTSIDYIDILSPTLFEQKCVEDFGNRTFWESLYFNENQNYNADC